MHYLSIHREINSDDYTLYFPVVKNEIYQLQMINLIKKIDQVHVGPTVNFHMIIIKSMRMCGLYF